MEYFLSTGNLVSNTGLDLQQTSGYTIIAEKLNFYRYLAHFRSIHRGAFFAQLKTTTVRKLLPESYGFLCPVHTPDGTPCGLLNHLSHTCRVQVHPLNVQGIPTLVASLGASSTPVTDGVCVQLDGKIIGYLSAPKSHEVALALRYYKVKGMHNVPLTLEIGYVPTSVGGQHPGLFLFSTPARFYRSVQHLVTDMPDAVGPFEQVYMDIAILPQDVIPETTHMDHSPSDMLSIVASLTPFSEFNQSPRNMYQCQMGKQTMGTPCLNLVNRTDNKMYRLQTGQTPIVRPKLHDALDMDRYPHGVNAVVCVISYTGYDMEDASIIQKSSYERGYGYGSIFKGEWVDLSVYKNKGDGITHFFGFTLSEEGEEDISLLRKHEEDHVLSFLDHDGLPMVGVRLASGDPYYAYHDTNTQRLVIKKYKGEPCIVDQVRLLGTEGDSQPLQKVHIKIRIPRPPMIGDKFSSRHGQKGVISQKWPSVDMPFSESGIIPDVIINPHAFPSRMTIGMFIESLAGKSGAVHGHTVDATPFQFDESHPCSEFFGHQLAKAGFNYYGNEPMYSGITGQEFKADIYQGVYITNQIVYYQRLRHMVSDKFQVRTTGPVDVLTHQPVKGRKRNGGIRVGEMERDSLLAHGVSFCLQDRLMDQSDYSRCDICIKCGSILSPIGAVGKSVCGNSLDGKACDGQIGNVAVPWVFRYLCAELCAMNVKLKLIVQ